MSVRQKSKKARKRAERFARPRLLTSNEIRSLHADAVRVSAEAKRLIAKRGL